jgi:[acyl-carrier-protein] S-malonyltransferase
VAEDIKVAFIFPGQESQSVGMGMDLQVHFNAAKAVYDEVDSTLGFPMSRLCFEGPEEDLLQTMNSQAAVMTTSVACLRAAQEVTGNVLPIPTYVAGHSVGEYAALVAAGVLTLSDAVRLVRERGRLMHEAGKRNGGGMMSILGLELELVENICLSVGVVVANINAPGHIVVSGSQDNLDKARRLAQVKGARRITNLRVSGPFHTQLMEPAIDGLRNSISGFTFMKPSVPVLSNVTAQPITEIEPLKEELTSQILRCVKWQQIIETMISKGITTFFEIGPGEVLTGLIKKISPGARTFNINSVETVSGIANWRKG